jgi:hypothetical protein
MVWSILHIRQSNIEQALTAVLMERWPMTRLLDILSGLLLFYDKTVDGAHTAVVGKERAIRQRITTDIE